MKRLGIGCGVVLLGAVLLVVGLYVAHGLAGRHDVREAKERAVEEVSAALPAAERTAARQQAALHARLEVTGEPTYAWRELECSLDSRDAGWIVQDYEQVCGVRTVELYAVDTPRSGSCRDRSLPIDDPLLGVARITRGPTASLQGERPWERSCSGDVLDGLGESRVLSGHRPDDLDASPAWVIAETRTSVSSTVVGCDPWGVAFCEQPFDEPVLPSELGS